MAIRKIITMKYFYNPIHFNLLERQEEGIEPYWTDIAPPKYDKLQVFPRFDTLNKLWSLEKRKEIGEYLNYDDLSLKVVYQFFDNIDLVGYNYGIIKNAGDIVLKNLERDRVEYQVASEQTIDFFKQRKIAKIYQEYEKAQVIKIVNGIEFCTPLMGQYYNQTALVRRRMAIISNEEMYMRITAIDGTIYKARLPVAFFDIILAKMDKISLSNNEIKTRLIELELPKLKTVAEIINLQINFPVIQELNINELADEFIANPNNKQEDRDYLASLDKKFFTEFV